MYRRTDRQLPLVGAPPGLDGRLHASWAEAFRQKVFPVLLRQEDTFAKVYADNNGRPCWSVARLLGLLVIQGMYDFTDQDLLDSLAFDRRWHHALDVRSEEAYLSRRSLISFRTRLASKDPDGELLRGVFAALLKAGVEDLKITATIQRLDSTRVMSNIATRGRTDLFGSTLQHFYNVVAKVSPASLAKLPSALRGWCEQDADGVFGWQDSREARARLPQLAGWLVRVRDVYAMDEGIRKLEVYQLVERLVAEQIVVREVEPPGVAGGGGPGDAAGGGPTTAEPAVELRKPASPGTSLQSPFDPDAGYGHKGPGYHVQIAETVGNERTELITDYDVHSAGVSDQGQVAQVHKRVCDQGLRPTTVVADAGYVSSEVLADAAEKLLELLAPANLGPLPHDMVGRDRWELDENGALARCPEGHPVSRRAKRVNPCGERTEHVFIDGEHCRRCPLVGKCLARGPNNGKLGSFHLEDNPVLRLRDQRATEQRAEAWKQRYRVRSGIEATNSELKRRHGLGRLRVRRAPRIRIAVASRIIGCNVKRWLRA